MNLTMWILYDGLSMYETKNGISNGSQGINGIRSFSDEQAFIRDKVYIGVCEEYFSCFSNSVILAHGYDYIIVKNVQLNDCLNSVFDIFEKYQNWDDRLRKAFYSSNPFQSVIDVTHDLIQQPMYFGQNNMRLYGITRQYSGQDVFNEWDEIKSINTIPIRFIERINQYNIPALYPDTIDPAVMPADLIPGVSNYYYTIRANCYYKGNIWGHLYIFYKQDTIPNSVFQLIHHVMSVFENLLDSMNEHDSEFDFSYPYLVDALDGIVLGKEIINNFYMSCGWTDSDWLMVYKISLSTESFDTVLNNWIIDTLNKRFSNGSIILFSYKKAIVIIDNRNHSDAELIEAINGILHFGNTHCGASLPFRGINNLLSYYQQAELAGEINDHGANEIVFFEEHAYQCIAKAFSKQVHFNDWIHPALFDLQQIDQEKGTDYYKTLYYYLLNKGHYENTAKALFIHRNTLIYRINNIKQLVGLDLNDEHLLGYLRFCYELMENIASHHM